MATVHQILQTPNERANLPGAGNSSDRALAGRVRAYFGANVVAFTLLLSGTLWLAQRLFSPAWYAWIFILPVAGIAAALLVERAISGLTNRALVALFRRQDANRLIASIERRIAAHPSGCDDVAILEEIRYELDACEDPPGVFLLLVRDRRMAQWPEWVLRALPVYVGLGKCSEGRELAVVSDCVLRVLPACDVLVAGRTTEERYVRVRLSRDDVSFVRNLAPGLEEERRRIFPTKRALGMAIVTHVMSEQHACEEVDEQLHCQHQEVLAETGLLPTSD